MVCSPGVDIIEPYTDGVTDFAVSSIVHQVRVKPTRIRCQPGNGETLEVEPVLRLRPEIEDLYIVCHNEQTRLEWQHRGEIDHFEVDAGDGRWQIVSDNHFSFSSRFSTDQVLKVRGLIRTEWVAIKRSIQILASLPGDHIPLTLIRVYRISFRPAVMASFFILKQTQLTGRCHF